jgi:predicted alpha-1,2-mannosidase
MRLIQKSIGFILLMSINLQALKSQDKSSWVNTFIGTDGTGHTFPGPSMPFGMVQPGPDNRNFGWNHTSGYQFQDTFLMGFSQTRLSGTGINEMGDVLLLPINPKKSKAKNAYYKTSEIARPGYYAITKKDDVKVELTCSERVAFHKYTYPENEAQLFVDFQHGLRFIFDENSAKPLVLASEVQIVDSVTITGYCSTSNWVNRKYFFIVQFDQPIANSTLLPRKEGNLAPQYLLDFQLGNAKTLNVKIALSTVDVNGAKQNLQTEINHWDFNKVYRNNRKTWNEYLDRISLQATNKQKEIFYTSLYHLLLQPSNIADIDGKYRGADGVVQIAPNKAYYSTLSNWDIYRAAFPLLQIIAPEKIDGIIQTCLLHHKAAGFLPIWTAWGQDNYCMIGNHAITTDLRVLMAQKHSKRWWKQAQKATSTPIGKSTTNLGIIPLIYWTMNRFQEPWKVGSMIGAYLKWLKNWGSKMWLMRFSRERCITRICMTVNPLFSEEKTQMASGEVRLTHSWLHRP